MILLATTREESGANHNELQTISMHAYISMLTN